MALAALGEVLETPPVPVPQDNAQANYAAKISKEEAVIDWNEDAIVIQRKIRAFNPFPGAASVLAGERIKLWRAQLATPIGDAPGMARQSPAGQLVIACGRGALSILELQRAGGKRMAAAQFLAGFPLTASARFGS